MFVLNIFREFIYNYSSQRFLVQTPKLRKHCLEGAGDGQCYVKTAEIINLYINENPHTLFSLELKIQVFYKIIV